MSAQKKSSQQPQAVRGKKKITVIHAADLHLGASFRSLEGLCPDWVLRRCRQAQEEAWERIVDQALARKADLLTVAGDSLDRGASLSARGAWIDGLSRLDEAGVPVVLIPGETDPAASALWESQELPPNTQVLGGPEGSTSVVVEGPDGKARAVVHGWLPGPEGARGHLPRPSRSSAHRGLVQIGLAHLWPDELDQEARLPHSSLPLWLLGGDHSYREVRSTREGSKSRVLYAGTPQGMGFDEAEPRGCVEIRWSSSGARVEQILLSPVIWRTLKLELSESWDVPRARQEILAELKVLRDSEMRRGAGKKKSARGRLQEAAFELLLVRLKLDGADFSGEDLGVEALADAVEAALGRELVVVAVEPRDMVAPEVRRALSQGGGFAGAVLEEVERAAEAGDARDRLLKALAAVWKDRELMEEAGLPVSSKAGSEQWLKRLLPATARQLVEAVRAAERD